MYLNFGMHLYPTSFYSRKNSQHFITVRYQRTEARIFIFNIR